MLTRRRDPWAPSPCSGSGEGEPRSSGPVGLAALPRPVAVVVGAGGALGAAHVGVGHALEQHGFRPDVGIGTSVGALNGAIAAAHPDRAAPWLEHVWTQLRRRGVYQLGFPASRAGIFTDRGLRRLIARAGLPTRVEELAVPFTAVAMDRVTGAAALLDRGDLTTALLKSAAIPGLLPPVTREGRTLVDGGVIAYVPVRAALRAGAASVVVAAAGPESSPLPATLPSRRAGAAASRAGLLLMRRQIERDLAEVSRRLPTVVLPIGTDVWPAPRGFRHSRRLVEAASATAGRFLDDLRVSGPGLYRAEDDPATATAAGHDAAASARTRRAPRSTPARAGL
ncbi:patatin-like phospholipase family protein [Streptomyces rubrogriseus]|uniref:Patatin-like phospholipase family protein n=1 Tax=Streptomyces rubrogriseus TaxID=194673 RepID=A0A6G3TTF3_9ACTN|nr:patatin-like phospholipase family protein [Streptomyces rubrogriseus]